MVTTHLFNWRRAYAWIIPVCLVSLAFSLHWFRLPRDLFFGFEQGRDAMASLAIVKQHDFVLVGPKTDIDGVFHGAWYYYFLAIPYAISNGNPLAASFSLVLLTSLVPVLMWWLGSGLTGSKVTGLTGAVLSIFSFEVIQYSRWLSNVTPALVGVVAVVTCLWYYRQTHHAKWWLLAATLAGLTAQFEIILTVWFGWLVIWLLITKQIRLPKLNLWLLGGVGFAVWYLPMVLFNIRNDWLALHSIQQYVAAGAATKHGSGLDALLAYAQQLARIAHLNLVGGNDWRWWVTVVVGSLGVLLALRQPRYRAAVWFCLSWWIMTLPVIFFAKSLSLPQLYIGSGLSVIWLWVLGIRAWWQPMWGKVVAMVAVLVVISSWWPVFQKLNHNQDVFFRTIQDDLNLADQRAALSYIHADAAGAPYRLQAYTIPYFQDQGWRYLHAYYYPETSDLGAKTIYVVIEKPVEAFWIKKWTEELGPTQLVDTKMFGLIKVEKRDIISATR